MNARRPTLLALYLIVGGLAAASLLVSRPAGAQTAKEQELEQRVAELEKLVHQLAPGPAAAAAPATKSASAPLQAQSITPNAAAGTSYLFTGYLKADALWTDTSDGVIAEGTAGRDFYVPGATPVGAAAKSTNMNADVKQTRLILGTDTPLNGDPKDKLATRVEFDFYGTSLGNQRVTNTFAPTLRHAYVQWRQWLVGQTWSNFQDATTLVDSVDYIGATDGTVFVRQPQVRFTDGGWSLSAENRQATLTPYHGGAQIVSDDGVLPDLTARYTWKFAGGQLSGAVLVRQLKYRQVGGTPNDSINTAAISLSGKISMGSDDLRFMVNDGNLGRYVGLNFSNDAQIDADGHFKAINGYAGFIAYRHVWDTALRSSLYYGLEHYNNDTLLSGTDVGRSSQSWTVNLIYSPVPKLEVGGEYRHARRELESERSGSFNRLQLMTKYSF